MPLSATPGNDPVGSGVCKPMQRGREKVGKHGESGSRNVVGLGQLSLVKADIIVGLFDNGTIKGYVYAPANPQPIVKDLEDWPPDLSNVDTAYRSIGNNWYLFVLRH